jgi:hypothetical protein
MENTSPCIDQRYAPLIHCIQKQTVQCRYQKSSKNKGYEVDSTSLTYGSEPKLMKFSRPLDIFPCFLSLVREGPYLFSYTSMTCFPFLRAQPIIFTTTLELTTNAELKKIYLSG